MNHSTNPTAGLPADPVGIAPPIRLVCRDAVGRRRSLTVTVRNGDLVLQAPPGEVAVLDSFRVARLVEVLHAADVLLGVHVTTTRPTPEQEL